MSYMPSKWVGIVGVFLVLQLNSFDCTFVNAEVTQLNETGSLARTLTKEEVVEAKKLIESTFGKIAPPFVGDGAADYLPIVVVHLDDLKRYKSEPEKLPKRSNLVIFPTDPTMVKENSQKIGADGQAFTTMDISANGEKDHRAKVPFAQFGPSPAFQMLFDAREKLPTKEGSLRDAPCLCFVVMFPAGNLWFLGDETSGKFKILIIDNSLKRLGLKKGEFRPAHEVFEALSKEARKNFYDLPPFQLGPSKVRQKQQQLKQKPQS